MRTTLRRPAPPLLCYLVRPDDHPANNGEGMRTFTEAERVKANKLRRDGLRWVRFTING